MRKKTLLLLSLSLGCGTTTGPDASLEFSVVADLNQSFSLSVGERAHIADADLYVSFVEVSEDSRCPSNALILCVWEGDGAVVFRAERSNSFQLTDTLHTSLDPKTVDVGSYVLDLQQLAPHPETTTPILQDDYEATFILSSQS